MSREVRYHISPTTGNPNKCEAKPGNCRYRGDSEHYATPEAARRAFEAEHTAFVKENDAPTEAVAALALRGSVAYAQKHGETYRPQAEHALKGLHTALGRLEAAGLRGVSSEHGDRVSLGGFSKRMSLSLEVNGEGALEATLTPAGASEGLRRALGEKTWPLSSKPSKLVGQLSGITEELAQKEAAFYESEERDSRARSGVVQEDYLNPFTGKKRLMDAKYFPSMEAAHQALEEETNESIYTVLSKQADGRLKVFVPAGEWTRPQFRRVENPLTGELEDKEERHFVNMTCAQEELERFPEEVREAAQFSRDSRGGTVLRLPQGSWDKLK